MQQMLDEAPQAARRCSDRFPTYSALFYAPGIHQAMGDKSQTYRVEGVNAELRHYLARLARKSRCFSRCIHALTRAVKLFVYAWNRRQRYRQQYPGYPAHLKLSLIHDIHHSRNDNSWYNLHNQIKKCIIFAELIDKDGKVL